MEWKSTTADLISWMIYTTIIVGLVFMLTLVRDLIYNGWIQIICLVVLFVLLFGWGGYLFFSALSEKGRMVYITVQWPYEETIRRIVAFLEDNDHPHWFPDPIGDEKRIIEISYMEVRLEILIEGDGASSRVYVGREPDTVAVHALCEDLDKVLENQVET